MSHQAVKKFEGIIRSLSELIEKQKTNTLNVNDKAEFIFMEKMVDKCIEVRGDQDILLRNFTTDDPEYFSNALADPFEDKDDVEQPFKEEVTELYNNALIKITEVTEYNEDYIDISEIKLIKEPTLSQLVRV